MLQEMKSKSETFNAIQRSLFYTFTPAPSDDEQFSMNPLMVWSDDDALSCSDDANWVFPQQEIRHILVESFRKVEAVASICAQIDEDESVIWTLLKTYDREARGQVHKKELEICQALHLYDFDFRVTSIEFVSPEELIGGGFQEIFKR